MVVYHLIQPKIENKYKGHFPFLATLQELRLKIKEITDSKNRLLSISARYGLAIMLCLFMLLIKFQLTKESNLDTPFLLMTFAIVASGLVGGFGPALLATIILSLAADYYFLPPLHSFFKHSTIDILTESLFFWEGVVISWLMGRQKKIKEEEHTAREELEVTLASIGDAVIVTNIQGQVTFMNAVAQHLTGWKLKDAIGMDIETIFPIINELTRKKVTNPITKVLQQRKIVGLANHTILISKNGREYIIDDSAAPIFNRSGEMLGVILVFRDFSKYKTLEEQRDLLLGTASHELKNNITGMKAYLQLIQRKVRKLNDGELPTFINRLDERINVHMKMINDLMEVTKIKTGKMELEKTKFNITNLARDIVKDLDQITKKHKIQFQGYIRQPVLADKVRIRQVFTNLISNAVKYSPSGGNIKIQLMDSNYEAQVAIKDSGMGISREKQKHLFEPFYRALDPDSKEKISGTGLGLYITSEILRQQGGKIWVESAQNKGSTFYFTIPLAVKNKRRAL